MNPDQYIFILTCFSFAVAAGLALSSPSEAIVLSIHR